MSSATSAPNNTLFLTAQSLGAWVPSRCSAAAQRGQGFALLGTLIGAFTIAVGVGPPTAPDIAYHIAIVVVLIWGLDITKRA
jgi:hypothetical protein